MPQTVPSLILKYLKRLLAFSLTFVGIQIAAAGDYYDRGTVEILTNKGSHRFVVELAKTPGERQKGLMHRDSLPINTGMLFMFEDVEIRHMWMLNTLIPLDILFADADKKIIKIEQNTQALSKKIISSEFPALWVLELRGGTSERLGLKVGDRLRLHKSYKNKP